MNKCRYCDAPANRILCGSVECKRIYQRERMREYQREKRGFYDAPRTGDCARCGDTYDLPPHGSAARKQYCSRKCQNARPGLARRRAERIVATAAKGTSGANVYIVTPSGVVIEALTPAEYWREASLSPLRRAVERGDGPGIVRALLAETEAEGDCRLWQKAKDARGYGKVLLGGKHRMAHRVMGEALFGPLHGEPIHHKCANPTCIAPTHMQRVSQRENVAEMLERNWYIKRIAELEEALVALAPTHPLVARSVA